MLAALMKHNESIAVTGSHGKTTTTSLISSVLESANFDPTTIIGGIVNKYKSTTRIGKSNWMVVEADESDGSLVNLFPKKISLSPFEKYFKMCSFIDSKELWCE